MVEVGCHRQREISPDLQSHQIKIIFLNRHKEIPHAFLINPNKIYMVQSQYKEISHVL